MASAYVISLALIALSGVLIDWHRRCWQQAQADRELAERDRRFALSQYRRRTQASGIIGVIGAAIGIGPLVPRAPLPITCYVVGLAFGCGCILVLALLDVWATRQQFRRICNEQISAQAKLAAELRTLGEASEADA